MQFDSCTSCVINLRGYSTFGGRCRLRADLLADRLFGGHRRARDGGIVLFLEDAETIFLFRYQMVRPVRDVVNIRRLGN